MKLSKLVFIIWIIACSQVLQGQTVVSLNNVIKAYQGEFSISLKANYKYYADFTKSPVSDSLDATMVMSGGDYYFKIAEYELAKEGQIHVTLDNQLKSISVMQSAQSTATFGLIDELLTSQNIKTSDFETNTKGMSGLRLTYQNSEIVYADMYINSTTNYITKCVIKYTNGFNEATKSIQYAKIVIEYSDVKKLDKSYLKQNYSINRFVKVSGQTVTLAEKYKSYTLESYLN